MVIREMQVIFPASSRNSICHTCVVRPRCTERAVPVPQPWYLPLQWQPSHAYFKAGWGAGYSVDGQVLPKLPGHQFPIGSGQRSDTFENILVFKHSHFAGAHDGCYG